MNQLITFGGTTSCINAATMVADTALRLPMSRSSRGASHELTNPLVLDGLEDDFLEAPRFLGLVVH